MKSCAQLTSSNEVQVAELNFWIIEQASNNQWQLVQVETVELLVTELKNWLVVSKELVEYQFDLCFQFARSKRGRRAFPYTATSRSDSRRNTRATAERVSCITVLCNIHNDYLPVKNDFDMTTLHTLVIVTSRFYRASSACYACRSR